MPTPLLIHRTKTRIPEILLFKDAPFVLGRVHEICGPSRIFMAVQLAAKTQGLVLWIRKKWTAEQLLPAGLIEFMDPARLLYLNADREDDLLWSMEEALRSGAVPTVIAELAAPPALTPIRRLLLAAESGTRRGHKPPLIVILTPDSGGAAGVETRWHAASVLAQNGKKWRMARTRSRLTQVAEWTLGVEDFASRS